MPSTIALFASSRRHGNTGRLIDRLAADLHIVACTSVCDEAAPAFVGALCETFNYLGMRFGGLLHANCVDGYEAARYEPDIRRFIGLLAGDAARAYT